MRIFAIILGSAFVGAAVGAIAAVVAFKSDIDAPTPLGKTNSTKSPLDSQLAPIVQVTQSSFLFGKMRRGETRAHEFIVKNIGAAPLTLEVGATTCKCTLGVASDKPIPPGESAPVRLEWVANGEPGGFRQSATLITNDPSRSQLMLTIEGQISAAEEIMPPEFLLGKVNAGESSSAHVFVMSMIEDTITVNGGELMHAGTRDLFDLKIEPVAREELPHPDALAGVRVTVTLKPGLPLGAFTQHVKVKTSLKDAPSIEIPVHGRIVGDISIFGPNWDEERGVLRLGGVKSVDGKSAKLNLVIRGPSATGTRFDVASVDPAELRAILGEPRRLNDSLVHVPIEIVVPPGTPSMVRLGTEQGKDGRITLTTTHPTLRELVIGVRFSVER